MISGVNFQPGLQDQQAQPNSGSSPSGSSQGVQEAIKVLSLRLPKVVGANAVAPSALLSAQGSGGNPRVDSIVEQVLRKYFPQAAQGPQAMPNAPSNAVNVSGGATGYRPPQAPPSNSPWSNLPRVVADTPITPPSYTPPLTGAPRPGAPSWDGGGGIPGGAMAPAPDLRGLLDWVPPQPDVRDRIPEI